jgi:hypothetical protein
MDQALAVRTAHTFYKIFRAFKALRHTQPEFAGMEGFGVRSTSFEDGGAKTFGGKRSPSYAQI